MTTFHVCLISAQAIANLLPLLLEKPDGALFLVSPEMTAQADRLARVAQPHGIRVEHKTIDAYDFDEVASVCQELLADGSREWTLNVTGGTKIAALAAFQTFFFDDKRIIYCDTQHDHLLQLAPQRQITKITDNILKVRDSLTCYGVPQVAGGLPPAGSEQRRQHLANLAGLLTDSELLSKLNTALEKQGRKTYANITFNELGPQAEQLVTLLSQCGVATVTSSNSLNIPNEDTLFFCKGGWLEEYVYWTAKALQIKGINIAINVRVHWDGKGRQTTENEFDVLLTHRNRLYIISCKAANPDRETASGSRATEALNELDTLKDRAGGLFGQAMLVSARRLSPYDRERAQKMRIELVDGAEINHLKDHLRRWLKLA